MQDKPAIFISYRRRDAGGHAGRLYEYLSGRFGDDHLFFDRTTIKGGDVFPDKLLQGVEGCAALLALIGPEWLDVQDKQGIRRLDDPNDFVRLEIARALERGKKIVPVLIQYIFVCTFSFFAGFFRSLLGAVISRSCPFGFLR